MKYLVLLSCLIISLFFFSCNGGKSSNAEGEEIDLGEDNQVKYLPDSESEFDTRLTYDSSIFLEDENDSKLFFSDSIGQTWQFVKYFSKLDGYRLWTSEGSNKYKGAQFDISWTYRSSDDDSVAVIQSLDLINPKKYLKTNTVYVYDVEQLENNIHNASPGDSIIIKSGIYHLSTNSYYEGLLINSDHVSLTGEPGVFIYADIDTNVIRVWADYISISNLHLSHLNSENSSCGGDVISVLPSDCHNLLIKNCDINGCGVNGISIWIKDNPKQILDYRFENNFIHNNSNSAFRIGDIKFQSDQFEYPGIKLKDNRVWNNGEDKINEATELTAVFDFGTPDTIFQKVINIYQGADYYRFEAVMDSSLAFYGKNTELPIGFINPSNFAKEGAKGLVVFKRYEPITFIDSSRLQVNERLTDLIESGKFLAIYEDATTVSQYYSEGGEDWGYFKNEVLTYFDKKGIKIYPSINNIHLFAELDSLKNAHGGTESGMGYLFVDGDKVLYQHHDQSFHVIEVGESFFDKPE